MAKKEKQKVPLVQYARDCIHADGLIMELIYKCKMKEANMELKHGCHSQTKCIYYNQPFKQCTDCGEQYGQHKQYCKKNNK